MSAPIIVGIEQVPVGETQQVFVPCFAPVATMHGYCFVPSNQVQGVWPSPYGCSDNTSTDWGYGMQRVPPHQSLGRHGRSVEKTNKPASGGRSCAQPVSMDTAMCQRGSSTPSEGSDGDCSTSAGVQSVSDGLEPQTSGLTPDTVTVVLGNLPKMLSTRIGLQVAFENSGFDTQVQAFAILVEKREAVVGLPSESVAQRFIKYFQGLKWATVRYCAAARVHLTIPPQESRVGESRVADSRVGESRVGEPVKHPKAKENPEAVTGLIMSKISDKNKCSDRYKDSSPVRSMVFLEGKLPVSPNPRTARWSDYDPEESDFEDDYQSTFAGTVLDNCGTSVDGDSVTCESLCDIEAPAINVGTSSHGSK